jgi:F-type H+-transporting ATPase subunit gamma
METEDTLKRRVDTAESLHSAVKTMKALAAVSIRQFEQAVEALADYNRTVELALQVVLRHRPGGRAVARPSVARRTGVVIFGSDQGMCGRLNDQIAVYAAERIEALDPGTGDARILAVGSRVEARLEDVGLHARDTLSVPNSTETITPAVQDVLLLLDEWHRKHGVDRVELYFSKHLQGASYRSETTRLLPVDDAWLERIGRRDWKSRRLPTFTMEWRALYTALIRQYLFVSIYRAFAESLASENASRLASMQGAESNIEERIRELTHEFQQRRQMKITEELLDIASGFEALTED